MTDIKRKTVLISGGSRGIGRATALRFAKAGYSVAILYAGNEKAAEETGKMVRELTADERYVPAAASEAASGSDPAAGQAGEGVPGFLAVKADVSSEAEVHEAVAKTLDTFGRVDTLVNCAGISRDALLIAAKTEDFDRTFEVNLRGIFLLSKEVFRPMMKQRSGRIVNISSVVGLHGNVGQAAYAAAKAGLIGLTKSTALEGAKRGILANAVAPGYVLTDMTGDLPEKVTDAMVSRIPLGRGAAPEEIAETVFFLGSEVNTYVTGQVLAVDGGMFM